MLFKYSLTMLAIKVHNNFSQQTQRSKQDVELYEPRPRYFQDIEAIVRHWRAKNFSVNVHNKILLRLCTLSVLKKQTLLFARVNVGEEENLCFCTGKHEAMVHFKSIIGVDHWNKYEAPTSQQLHGLALHVHTQAPFDLNYNQKADLEIRSYMWEKLCNW